MTAPAHKKGHTQLQQHMKQKITSPVIKQHGHSVAASGDSGSALPDVWSRTAKRTCVTPKPRWSINNNNKDNDNNSKKSNNRDSLHFGGNVDDSDTHSGHNYNVPSSSAVHTCCAPTRRQLHHNTQHVRDDSNFANHKARTARTAPITAQQTQ